MVGLVNDEVKPYNSLDLGVTFLASKNVIVILPNLFISNFY